MKKFLTKIGRHANSVFFVLGFAWDNLMLTRIDLIRDNLFFLGYLFLSGACIIAQNAYESGRRGIGLQERHVRYLPYIMQFSFGSLFSASVVFYSRSASLTQNWPFLVGLILLFFGNELFRKRYQELTFEVSIFFIVLFSYAIFSLPLVVHAMGDVEFVESGAIAILSLVVFLAILRRFAGSRFTQSIRGLVVSIVSIYILFNIAYFNNFIPPIPLSLKSIGVYHIIERLSDGRYAEAYEAAPWYEFRKTSDVFHSPPGEPVYVLSSVFAPNQLSTTIMHIWYHYDQNSAVWQKTDTLLFPIVGGRDGGYRGYSIKTAPNPGRWKVDVVTDKDRLIGRLEFEVMTATSTPALTGTIE